jgi:hypothetical protein
MKKEPHYVWIVAIDSDSFNHVPQRVTKKQAAKFGFTTYVSEKSCQHACDLQNSL